MMTLRTRLALVVALAAASAYAGIGRVYRVDRLAPRASGSVYVLTPTGGAAPAWSPPQSASLRAWYGFNSDQANPTDLSGYGSLCTRQGNPVWSSSAYTLDGSGDYFDTPSNLVNHVAALTIAMWVKPSAIVNADGIIYCRDAADTIGFYMSGTDGAVRFLHESDASNIDNFITPNRAISTSSWTHLVVTLDHAGDDKARIYTNGLLSATGSGAAGDYTQYYDDYLRIGYDDLASSRQMAGSVDAVMVWATCLTSNEVWTLYSTQPNVPAGGAEGSGL